MNSTSERFRRKQVGYFQINNRVYPVYDGLNFIGRNLNSTIFLPDTKFSKIHAVISVINEHQHFISDCNSSNGTWLENEALVPYLFYKLEDTTKVRLGDALGTYTLEYPRNIPEKDYTADSPQRAAVPDDIYIASTQQLDDFHEAETQIATTSLQTNKIQKQTDNCKNITSTKPTDTETCQDIFSEFNTPVYDDVFANESFRVSLIENSSAYGLVVDETVLCDTTENNSENLTAQTDRNCNLEKNIKDNYVCSKICDDNKIIKDSDMTDDSDTDIDQDLLDKISKEIVLNNDSDKIVSGIILSNTTKHNSDSETDIENSTNIRICNKNIDKNKVSVEDSDTDVDESFISAVNKLKVADSNANDKKKQVQKILASNSDSETDIDEEYVVTQTKTNNPTTSYNENDETGDELDLMPATQDLLRNTNSNSELRKINTTAISNTREKSVAANTTNKLSQDQEKSILLENENSNDEFDLLTMPNYGLTEQASISLNISNGKEKVSDANLSKTAGHEVIVSTEEKINHNEENQSASRNNETCTTGAEKIDLLAPTQLLNALKTPLEEKLSNNTENEIRKSQYEKVDLVVPIQILNYNKNKHTVDKNDLEPGQLLNINENRKKYIKKLKKNEFEDDLAETQPLPDSEEHISEKITGKESSSSTEPLLPYEINDLYESISTEPECVKCKNKCCSCNAKEDNTTKQKEDIISNQKVNDICKDKAQTSDKLHEVDDFDLMPTQKLIFPGSNVTNNVSIDENVIEDDDDIFPATQELKKSPKKILIRHVSQINNDFVIKREPNTSFDEIEEDEDFLAPTQKLVFIDYDNLNKNTCGDIIKANTKKSNTILRVDSEKKINSNVIEDDDYLPPMQILPTNSTSEVSKAQKASSLELNANKAKKLPVETSVNIRSKVLNKNDVSNLEDDLAPTQKLLKLPGKTSKKEITASKTSQSKIFEKNIANNLVDDDIFLAPTQKLYECPSKVSTKEIPACQTSTYQSKILEKNIATQKLHTRSSKSNSKETITKKASTSQIKTFENNATKNFIDDDIFLAATQKLHASTKTSSKETILNKASTSEITTHVQNTTKTFDDGVDIFLAATQILHESSSKRNTREIIGDEDFDSLPATQILSSNCFSEINKIQNISTFPLKLNTDKVKSEPNEALPCTSKSKPVEKSVHTITNQNDVDLIALTQKLQQISTEKDKIKTEDDYSLPPIQILSTNNHSNMNEKFSTNDADFLPPKRKLPQRATKTNNKEIEDKDLLSTHILSASNCSEFNKNENVSIFPLRLNALPSTSTSKPLVKSKSTVEKVSDNANLMAPAQKLIHPRSQSKIAEIVRDDLIPAQILPLNTENTKMKTNKRPEDDNSLLPTQKLSTETLNLNKINSKKEETEKLKSATENNKTNNSDLMKMRKFFDNIKQQAISKIINDDNKGIDIDEKKQSGFSNNKNKLIQEETKNKPNIKSSRKTKNMVVGSKKAVKNENVINATKTNAKLITNQKSKERQDDEEESPNKKLKLSSNKNETKTTDESANKRISSRKRTKSGDKSSDESLNIPKKRAAKSAIALNFSDQISNHENNKSTAATRSRIAATKKLSPVEDKSKTNTNESISNIKCRQTKQFSAEKPSAKVDTNKKRGTVTDKKETNKKLFPHRVNDSNDETESSIREYINKKVIKIHYSEESESVSTDSNSYIVPNRRSRRSRQLQSSSDEESSINEVNLTIQNPTKTYTRKPKTISGESSAETILINKDTSNKKTRRQVSKSMTSEESLISSVSRNTTNTTMPRAYSEEEYPNKRTKKSDALNNYVVQTLTNSPRRHKVIFTMLLDSALEESVKRLGGIVTEDVYNSTVLVTSKISRSLKFLAAVGLGKPIADPNWIIQSVKAGKFLDPGSFILSDPDVEKKFNFSLKEALQRAAATRLLADYIILLAVNKNADVLKEIVEICGGKCVRRAPSKNTCAKVMVVSYKEDRAKYVKYLQHEPPFPVVLPEAIFSGVLTQKLVWKDHFLS